MESQGNGKRVRDICAAAEGRKRSGAQITKVRRYVIACAIACLALLWGGLAVATSYVYDANGRVVAVTQSNGQSAQYVYDNLGNLVQVTSLAAGQLAVFAFTPSHGEAGTEVTIQGQGFSTTLANDAVKFNGTAATVLSATASQIVTEVPAGATTGPISVTVGGVTAQSTNSFVVDDTGEAPTITSVSPTVVANGSSVTVTGTNLDPVANQTNVLISNQGSTLTSVTNTQLQTTPVTSGYITVQTPYGQATSTSPIVLLPTGYTASQITSTQVATVNGSAVNMNVATSNQWSVLQFNATAGSWITLQSSAMTPTSASVTYYVYSPDNTLVQSGTINQYAPTIHLPQLPTAGIYSVFFQSNTASTQMGVQVLTDTSLSVNTPVTTSTNVGYESQRLLFQGTAGQTVTLALNNVTTSSELGYTVYAPNGSVYTSGTFESPTAINLQNLASTGSYQIIISVYYGEAAATFSTQVELLTNTIANEPTNGTSEGYSISASYENAYFNFTATQGQNLELTLNDISSGGLSVNVYNAGGTNVTSFACSASNLGSSCTQSLWNLAAGVYSVVVTPTASGAVTFNALIEPDVSGAALTSGTVTNVNLAAGQAERYSFTGTAGQNVALELSNLVSVPAGEIATIYIYRPDVGVITPSDAYAHAALSGQDTFNLQNLPVSGKYTIVITTQYGLPITGQLTFLESSTTNLAANGTSQAYSTTEASQELYFSFSATQNQNLELSITNLIATGGTNQSAYFNIYTSSGAFYSSFTCPASGSGSICNQSLWNLPAGNYTVIFEGVNNLPGPVQFDLTLQADIAGPSLVAGTAQNISLSTGSVERFTFTGTAGQNVSLQLSGVSTTPSGSSIEAMVYRPDTGLPTASTYYTFVTASGSSLVNISDLPVSGTYTVIVMCGVPSTAQLTLFADAAQSLALNGSAGSLSTTASGQNAYLTFTTTQTQNLELTLNNISLAGTSYANVNILVVNSAGTVVSQSGFGAECIPTENPGASCITPLWNLPAGTYTAIVSPYAGGTIQFDALLTQDIAGPVLAAGTPANITLGAGQVERLTFNGAAGSTVALQLSNVTTTPSGSDVLAAVYSPNGLPITPQPPSLNTSGAATTLNMTDLPATGTYTVVVYNYYGIPATATVELANGETASQPTNGTSESYSPVDAGQNTYLSFTATQGQNLQLTLNNISFNGSSTNSFDVNVLNSINQSINGLTCSQSNPGASCSLTLWDLNAGTYTIQIVPTGGGTMRFDTVLEPFTTGSTLTVGTPVTATLAAGEVEQFAFNANAYDTVELQLANVSTTPAGQPVYVNVYAPNTGAANYNNYLTTASLSSGSATIPLSNLPATGTYQVVLFSDYGLPASAQLTEVSDTPLPPPTLGTPTLPTTGVPQSEQTSSGQSLTMTFNATTQGQNIELTFDNITLTGSSGGEFIATVTNPSGTVLATMTCTQGEGGTCTQSLWNLPEGTYTVVAQPQGGGTMQFDAIAAVDTTGSALTTTAPASVSLNAGQVERYTFTGTQGNTMTLGISNVVTNASWGEVVVSVYRPDVGVITTSDYYTQADLDNGHSAAINLNDLPVRGTYTVVVSSYGFPATLQLSLANPSASTLADNGQPVSYASTVSGQNVGFSFNATNGQNLELTLNNVSMTSNSSYDIDVLNSGGVNIGSTYCTTGNPGTSCTVPLWNLPAGSYSVLIEPRGAVGTMSFDALLQPDVSGGALTLGTVANVSLAAGQAERFTFSGTQGGNLAVELANVATTPSGQSVSAYVYSPNGEAITIGNEYAQVQSSSAPSVVALTDLPESGTYTVVVSTSYGIPATAQLTVVNEDLPTQPSNGTAETYSTISPTQNIYIPFVATQDQNLELTFNNIILSGTDAMEVSVTNAQGGSVASFWCYSSSGTSCTQSLWNLNVGNYSIEIQPYVSGTMQFTAYLSTDIAGPTLAAGTAQNVSLSEGQTERFTFSGTAGQTVALELSGLATTPVGQAVYLQVYRPDLGVILANNGTISASNAYASTNTSTGTVTLNLPNLPVTGTYTVVLNGNLEVPVTGQLTLVSGETGTLATNGTAVTETSKGAGENVDFNFTATQGQNLEFVLSNFSVTGASNTFNVFVYNAGGAQIANFACAPSSLTTVCKTSLWNLAAGTYSVMAEPPAGGVLQLTAQLQPDVIGAALSANEATSVSLAAGEVERFTFTGAANTPTTLQIANVTTSPSGQDFEAYVYAPGSSIGTTNAYTSIAAPSGSTTILPLSNLPVSGAYTLVLRTDNGESGTAQITMTGLAGTLGSVPNNFAASGVGNTVTASFVVASTGQNLELTMNNVNASGASTDGFEVNVTNPAGEDVANFYCYGTTPGASCSQSLWNLTSGTYTVTAVPIWGGVISFTGVLLPDVSGPTLTSGTASTITLTAGQVERVKFAGTAGNAATLQVASVSTTPANQNVYVYLYLPSVGTITTDDAYEVLQATGSNSLSIPSLPVTGTYTAIVTTGTGIPASAQLTYTQ